ncbi:protein dimerizations [Zea mays]|uniref:Protein dimerizations n=1 Tax=Zea mays TaxID=4577 RepID=A0A1D6QTY7_MAIZE|nr:protein dimerizations [Zea mays]
MDGGLDDEWEASFLDEVIRATDEAEAVVSRNPNPTPTPAPAPIPTYYPLAAAPVSYLPASSVSYIPAASHLRSAISFSPPRDLSQRPPLPPPTAATSTRDALATGADVGRDFSPPPQLSQRPAADEGSLVAFAASSSASDRRFISTGCGEAGAKREAREIERLKRELDRVSKERNELKNECTALKKDRTKKDLQIKAKEAEIQNLKKANVSMKDVCSAGMNIDQSFHAPANEALHTGVSSRRTDKMSGKDKDAHSLRDDLYLKQGHQTDLLEALELRRRTMIDNGMSTSGVVSLEEDTHFEPRNATCKEIKAIGVQTDNTSDNEHLDCKKLLVERISGNLRAMWGMSPNSLSSRNLISKINVSCSEEILSLLQHTRLSDNCEPSSQAISSMNEAISQLYDTFIKMNSGKMSIQTFLEALLNLCAFDDVRSETPIFSFRL